MNEALLRVQEEIAALCEAFNGRCGCHAIDLQTGETVGVNDGELFPTASAIKLPVLITLMAQAENGRFSLDDPLMLRQADQIGGSGVLRYLTPGLTATVRDWAFLMMNLSDNSATNVLIDHVGLAAVQDWLAENEFTDVHLHSKIDLPALSDDQNRFGTATPAGMTRLLTAVFRRELVSPAACAEMLRMMDGVGQERIGRYLPFAPFGEETPAAEKLHLAGKTGSFKGTRVHTAVVWRGEWPEVQGFALTVMSRGNPEPEVWSVDAPGTILSGRIGRLLYDHAFSE